MNEKILETKEEINSFVELNKWLSSRRLVSEFLDWCDSMRNVNISAMLIKRAAEKEENAKKEQEEMILTPRQKLCLDLGKEFFENMQTRLAYS